MAKVKLKTHKGLKKRIRITARKKVRIRRAGAGHLLSHKSGDRCRRLRRPKIFTGKVASKMQELCPEA
jgi:large subunit ribosomal protein L35